MSALYFDARIDGTRLQKDINQINQKMSRMTTRFEKEGRKIDAVGSRIGTALAGAFSVFALGGFIKQIAKVRGEFQALEVAFETMLGNKVEADKLMAEVVEFTAKTPFDVESVARASKTLIAFGTETKNVIPTLQRLGDISAALNQPMNELVAIYGKAQSTGKLMTEQLNQFAERGIPIVAELESMFGIAGAEVYEMASQSKISFEILQQVIENLTNETGKFNGLMEKTSGTIKGLISNFGDAWTNMLNDIGESNEGIISGSLKGAINLVENYEKVINTLKVLIATYGAYKAAVIAAAVAQQASRWVQTIRLVAMYRKEMGLATAAQQAFNVSAKANPYGLILAAITAIVTTLVVFNKKQEEASAISQEFVSNLTAEKKAIDALFQSASNTSKTYEDRREAIKQINDKYGDYLDNLLTEKSSLEEIKEAQDEVNRAMAQNLAAKSMENQVSGIREQVTEQEKALSEAFSSVVNNLKLTPEQQGQLSATIEQSLLDPESLRQSLRETLEGFGVEISTFGAGQDAISASKVTQLEFAIQKVVNAREKEQQAVKDTEKAYKSYLEAIGITGGGKDEPETLTTINEKIEETKILLDKAKQKLEELREGESTAEVSDIEKQQGTIDELEKKLEALTGISAKISKEKEKAAKEQLDAAVDFADQQIQLERDLQASKIAIMKSGYDKQKAEAELAHQNELSRIKSQQQAYEQAWKASLGSGEASEEEKAQFNAAMLQFDELRENAEQEKAQKIEAINRKAAKEVENIWSEVTESFLNNTQSEINAINEKYDKLIKRAKQAGETDLSRINKAREKEIEETYINAAINELDFQERIELQRAEIANQGFNREVEMERKKLEIVKDFAQKKIDVLKKSGKKEAEQDISMLKLIIKAADEGLADLDQKTLTSALEKTERMVGEFQNLTDAIFGADTQLSNMLGGLGQMANSISRIAAGDYSGAIALITQFYKMSMDTSRVEKKLADPWIEFEKWIAASNRELERYIQLRDSAIGYDRYTSSNQAIEEIIENIQEAENELANLSLSFTLEGSGWFNKANREVAEQVKELQESLGGLLKEEDYREWGVAFWEKVKAVYSFDLDDLLFDQDGEFTISKINELIDEGVITDQKVIDAINYYEQLVGELTQAEQQKQELLTATMADNIADGIIDGFKQGYDSASDFADDFEELMKNAILNAIKIQTLEEPLREWYRQFADYSESGDILTEGEIADLEKSYDNIIESARQRFEEMKRISGLNFDAEGDMQKDGLTGAIKGITEETAGLIAGQFFAFRELQAKTYFTATEQLDGINQSVIHLAEIAANTRHNSKLNDIDEKMSDLNNYLKEAI